MDFQAFVDCVEKACCVMSVEKTPEGRCGKIRILCANEPYKDIMGPKYYDGMPYYELVPKESKFEDMVFQCAFGGKRLHAYVPTEGIHNTWTDQVHIPLKQENDHLGYCQFMFDFTQEVDPEKMAAVTAKTAETVIRNSLLLLGASDFREGIQAVVKDLQISTDAEVCRIILLDEKQRKAVTFSDHANVTGRPRVDVPYDIVKSWDAIIGVSDGIMVKDEAQMQELAERAPVWTAHMRASGVDSVVLFPLKSGEETIGYMYVVNYDTERAVEVKEMLQLMAFILGSEIAGFQLRERLAWISRMDELTGIRNRNALWRRMDELKTASDIWPLGVVNMDLNGLKAANDLHGHDAGDRLIQYAAGIMQQIFPGDDLYRAGGDEFIAIVPRVSEEDFRRKIRQLQTICDEDPEFSVAVGPSWHVDDSQGLKSVFEEADRRMYDNKRAFYRRHPERDRRHLLDR